MSKTPKGKPSKPTTLPPHPPPLKTGKASIDLKTQIEDLKKLYGSADVHDALDKVIGMIDELNESLKALK